jgi:diguanylate cyclase (GGDEF)-like protein
MLMNVPQVEVKTDESHGTDINLGYTTSGIYKKIEKLNSMWKALEENWNGSELVEFKRQLHQLHRLSCAQSIASLTVDTTNLEQYIELRCKDEYIPSKEQFSYVASNLAAFRKAAADENLSRKTAVDAIKPLNALALAKTITDNEFLVEQNYLIILISTNKDRSYFITSQLTNSGYQVEIRQSLNELAENPGGKLPGAIVMETVPNPNTGKAIAQVRSQLKAHIPVVFISSNSDITARLAAVKAEGNAFLVWPPNINELVDHLDHLTAPSIPQAYRIMVVEDSPTTASICASILEEAGMFTAVVTEPLQIMQTLIEFTPELILMDMYMPECTGLDLAGVIRQQSAYFSIPIVFLSAETDLEKQLKAIQLGGDDFLTKPIRNEHLVSIVTSRVQRSRNLRSFMERDSLTGLYNHARTKEQLELEILKARRSSTELVFAMIDIDHFKRVNDTYGHPIGDRVIKNLARLLVQSLRKSDIVGRYGGEEFVVLLPEVSLDIGRQVLERLRQNFSELKHYAEGQEFSCTFSCGLAAYPEAENSYNLNRLADAALYIAKNQGRNQVVVSKNGNLGD